MLSAQFIFFCLLDEVLSMLSAQFIFFCLLDEEL